MGSPVSQSVAPLAHYTLLAIQLGRALLRLGQLLFWSFVLSGLCRTRSGSDRCGRRLPVDAPCSRVLVSGGLDPLVRTSSLLPLCDPSDLSGFVGRPGI